MDIYKRENSFYLEDVDMQLCIVEDQNYRQLYPLTKTRPVFGLRCGRFTIEERILNAIGRPVDGVYYQVRPELQPLWKIKNKAGKIAGFGIPETGNRLILNGRALFDHKVLGKIVSGIEWEESQVWLADDTWLAVYLPAGHPLTLDGELLDGKFNLSVFPHQNYLDVKVIKYPWDLIRYNSKMIQSDFDWISGQIHRLRFPALPKQVAVLNYENLIIGKHSEIYPFVTFDGTNGPIIIGDNVTIESGSFIKGPVSIGDNCLISANTKIYNGTTLGETCKVGGEISHSIIHGYSNKRHSGFLGNSYLGEWINLGAGTHNSNMKNNYNFISVQVDDEIIDTGTQFVGVFMGDHSRSAIGTRFNTATFVGIGCNIFSDGLPPKQIPDFTWGGGHLSDIHDFDKFIENACRMQIRREVELSEEEFCLLKSLHECRSIEKAQTKILNHRRRSSNGF